MLVLADSSVRRSYLVTNKVEGDQRGPQLKPERVYRANQFLLLYHCCCCSRGYNETIDIHQRFVVGTSGFCTIIQEGTVILVSVCR